MNYLEQLLYVRGPYKRKKDNRSAIWLYYQDGRKRFISYPKFLVEVVLERELHRDDETVDHIDRDVLNNRWDNLRVVDRQTHASEDHVRVQHVPATCVWCGSKTLKRPNQIKAQQATAKAGPFCTQRCSGQYGAAVQNSNLPEPPDRYYRWHLYAEAEPIYYTATKLGETVADMAERLGLELPTEEEILASLPRKTDLRKKKTSAVRKRTTAPVQPCVVCRQPTKNKRYCSSECYQQGRTKTKWPPKEKLQKLVWKYPTTYIAKRLGVSDAAVSKHCKKLGIEKPPRGYWAQQRAKDR